MSDEEKKRRIQVVMWAYAYEIENDSLVSDFVYDDTCRKIDLSVDTDDPEMDAWFREHFFPDSGMWVYKHPHFDRLKVTYDGIVEAREKENE